MRCSCTARPVSARRTSCARSRPRSCARRRALAAPAREAALAWLRSAGVADAERALDNAGGAPLLARELAEPEEAELRRRVLAELARPGGADGLQFAPAIERSNLERFIF